MSTAALPAAPPKPTSGTLSTAPSMPSAPVDGAPITASSSALTIRTQPQSQTTGLRTPSNRKTIYDRNLNRTRGAELSRAGFAYLFAEMVMYAQRRVTGIQDLERRLNEQGYPLGLRLLSLLTARTHMPTLSSTPPPSSSNTSNPQRPTRILPLLQFLSNTLWRTLFSRPCDSLEKSATNANEYMLSDNEPLTNMFVSVPKEMSMFNPGAYVAGIIEGVCDGLGLTARVSAHNAGTEMWPQRTVWLLAFDEGVVRREELLVKAERDAKR